MSHYLLFVIGENPEEQLAPFHQFECTGKNDQYVQTIDVTDEHNDTFKRYSKDEDESYTFESYLKAESFAKLDNDETLDLEKKHKYGYYTLKPNGTVDKIFNRTNPNSKWDYYVLGGRWQGFFKVKENASSQLGSQSLLFPYELKKNRADSLEIVDVRFDLMFRTSKKKLKKEFNTWFKITSPFEKPLPFQNFIDNNSDKKTAWEEYRKQDAISAYRKHDPYFFGCYNKKFGNNLKEYTNRKYLIDSMPYALLVNGKWIEQKNIMIENDSYLEPKEQWSHYVWNIIKNMPKNTKIHAFDCHI